MSIAAKAIKEWRDNVIRVQSADFKAGYNDTSAGYYDKWYRYNRKDSGIAYDNGVKAAMNENKGHDDVHIIECTH